MNHLHRVLVSLLVFAIACGSSHAAPQWIGDVFASIHIPNGVLLNLDSGAIALVQFVDEGIVQVRIAPTGTFTGLETGAVIQNLFVAPDVTIFTDATSFWLSTTAMSIQINRRPFGVIAYHADGTAMSADALPGVSWDPVTELITSTRMAPADEGYFGLGQRGGPVNRRGRSLLMRNTDEFAYGEFSDPLYQSFPLMYVVRNGRTSGLFLDTPAYSFFDVALANPTGLTFGAVTGDLNYYIIAGPTPVEVAQGYARLTGPPPMPPLWTLGYHHSRYGWTTAAEVLGIAAMMRTEAIPCDVMWFDIDYMDNFHHFTWDPVRFADPVGMNQQLDAQGFERVYINEPCFVLDDPLYGSLDGGRFFVRNTFDQSVVTSIFLGDVSWLDFTKSAVIDWYKSQLAVFLSKGVSALWNDLNEPASNLMPLAIYDFDGAPRMEDETRNIYALYENLMAYEAQLQARPNVRPWNLSRSGFSGIQRYAATWSGDTLSTFDSLRVSIQMSASMGLSGMLQFGHDIGGFLGSPDPELFIRWLEFSSYTLFMRTHSVNTAAPREPWSFGEPYTTMIRDQIETHYRWMPLLYSLAERTTRTGEPPLAPLVYHFPADQAVWTSDTEFMLGSDILVAPVFVQGAVTRQVTLPAGSMWYDTLTGDVLQGGSVATVNAPLGVTPVFARQGAIIPLGEVKQNVREQGKDNFTIEVYPGGISAFELYEDDGVSFDYQSGTYRRTLLSSEFSPLARGLRIEPGGGQMPAPTRSWTIEFIAEDAVPTAVRLNGATVSQCAAPQSLCWSYDAITKRVSVVIPAAMVTDTMFVELDRAPACCIGDTNGDGLRNSADLAEILSFWGAIGPAGTNGDANCDGVRDSADIAALLALWNIPCAP